jgi:hypothetical protein
MEALIADMVQEDPKKRPTMDEVVNRFAEIKSRLSTWKLRSRMARNNEIWPVTAWRTVGHWYWTIGHVITLKLLFRNPNDCSNFPLTCIPSLSHSPTVRRTSYMLSWLLSSALDKSLCSYFYLERDVAYTGTVIPLIINLNCSEKLK